MKYALLLFWSNYRKCCVLSQSSIWRRSCIQKLKEDSKLLHFDSRSCCVRWFKLYMLQVCLFLFKVSMFLHRLHKSGHLTWCVLWWLWIWTIIKNKSLSLRFFCYKLKFSWDSINRFFLEVKCSLLVFYFQHKVIKILCEIKCKSEPEVVLVP